MEIVFAYGKCVFARPRIENVDDMVEMMNNEKISSMLSARRRVITREFEIEWINQHQNDHTFSAYDSETLEYIGNCGYNEIDGGRGEIGITICEHMQGKHYAKDMISGLVRYGFRELGLDEIYAIVFSDNVRSLNCVTQLGFQEYARNKNILERNGIPVDDIFLSLKRGGNMKLVWPSMEYDKAIQVYRQEFLDTGDSMDGGGSLRKFDRTQDWLDRVESYKRVETMPSPWVPTSQYIYIRETDNKVVGVIQIRHYFNEYLEKFGGHIGYSVAPSERRKGYATQMLKLVLPECVKLGIDRVLITCVQGNEGSKRTILNNGGVFESTVFDPEDGCWLERYWIDLSE